jgi:hypothetical protein
MSYIIPEATRIQWKQQAKAANIPYATIVGQHIYDLQGLAEVLSQQLAQATQTLNAIEANTSATAEARHKVAELSKKLEHCQLQLMAYQQEQGA